ncbi:hypothetical protein RI129_006486 [Pyrocoelia pectoralis]|uniref:Acyl-coenzyme A oxidase n=1 Tax=Pyrocoelia pectoralis TaxID=417401 RepID=A0AAN7ZPL3_9COLE
MFDVNDIRKKMDLEHGTLPTHVKLHLTDPPVSVKGYICFNMFFETVYTYGTARHQKYCKLSYEGKITGALCITEVSHGSDTKYIQTTARYNEGAKEFILNTPNFLAAKCWIGNLGKVATHIVLFAQLITSDNICHGPHMFVVNIRNPKTLLSYPGITIADLGSKVGLETLDNGLIMFNNYRIPKENLLNKLADVSDDGMYISRISNPIEQFGISLGILSSGRINVLEITTSFMRYGITVAMRYAAKKQSVANDRNATSILKYASNNQIRLIPYLALVYVNEIMYNYMRSVQDRIFQALYEGNTMMALRAELHALSSAAKSISTGLVRDGIRECMEVCGDHGYLIFSALGDIYNGNDASCTYEGDNSILLQQTAIWLLKLRHNALQKENNVTLSSTNFLFNSEEILNTKFKITCLADFIKPQNLLAYFQWLTCYLLKTTYEKQLSLTKNGNASFARNDSQVYYSRNLASAYLLTFFIQRSNLIISEAPDESLKRVLLQLLSLYGVWNLQKYIHYFYQGTYTSGPMFGQFTEDSILFLCNNLKDDAVSLVNVIAPPDFLLNSAIGHVDGKVFKRLDSSLTHTSNVFSKLNWSTQMPDWKNCISKL